MARVPINNGDTGLTVRNALNGNFIELYASAADAVAGLAGKVDTATLTAALALKADASALAAKADTSALALKADTSALAAKADSSALTSGLALKLNTADFVSTLQTNLAAATAATLLKAEQTGTNYTLVLADNGCYIPMNRASAQTLTVPNNSTVAFPLGTTISVVQRGAGAITITPDAGVGLTKMAALSLVSAGQFGVVTLVKEATNTWNVFGALGVI